MKKNQKIVSLDKEEMVSLYNNGKLRRTVSKEVKQEKEKEKTNDEKEKEITKHTFDSEEETNINIQKENTKQNKEIKQSVKTKEGKVESDSTKRESSYKIGAFVVKDQEVPKEEINENGAEEGEKGDDFVVFDSKTESILKPSSKQQKKEEVKRIQKDVSKEFQSRHRKETKMEKEIDKEIKEIERAILLNLSQTPSSESSEIISVKKSDTIKKKSDSAKDKEKQSSPKLLTSYRGEKEKNSYEEKSESALMQELEEKLNEIVNKRTEIEELNKEKTILFDNYHPQIKSKISTEIEALNSLINEKEGRISHLKTKISILPHKLDELSETINKLKNLQAKINQEFDISFARLNETISKMKEAKSENVMELGLLKSQIIELASIYSSLKQEEERISNSIAFIKQRISTSQAELLNLEGQFEEMKNSSKSIEMRINEVSKTIKLINEDLKSSASKIKDLENLNAELIGRKSEYEKAQEIFNKKIKDYEQEILSLRNSLQLEISSKYLSEIEKLSLSNENDMNSLLSEEKRINSSIEQKKRELLQLLEEAKQLRSILNSRYNADVPDSELIECQEDNQGYQEDNQDSDHYSIQFSEKGFSSFQSNDSVQTGKIDLKSSSQQQEKKSFFDNLIKDLKSKFNK